jgi:hypothetical protein
VQAYFSSRQYKRALHLLRTSNVLELSAEFTYLAGCCLAECGDWDALLELLPDDDGALEPLALQVRPSRPESHTAIGAGSMFN